MRDPKMTRALIDAARRGLAALELMVKETVGFADEIFGFHAQQAIEKILKAWIAHQGIIYPLTHNLEQLIEIAGGAGLIVEEHDRFGRFSVYAVRFRYESEIASPEPINRQEAAAEIRNLFDRISSLIVDSSG